MSLEVPPDVEAAVLQRVGTGLYHTADEVLRAAMHVLAWAETDAAGKLQLIRRAIQAGIDEAERGELVKGEEVAREMRELARGDDS